MTPIGPLILLIGITTMVVAIATISHAVGRRTGYLRGKRRGAYESKWCYDVVAFDADGREIGEDTARPSSPAVVEEAYGMSVVVLPGYEGEGEHEGEVGVPHSKPTRSGKARVAETSDEDPWEGVDA